VDAGDRRAAGAAGLGLRVAGRSCEQVATECGYASATTACRAVTRFGDGLPEVDRDRMRSVAIERGEQLWAEAWEDVVERRPGAVTAAVRVLGRQASLLGLDAPARSITETHETKVEQVFAWLRPDTDEAPSRCGLGDGSRN
jgi:hypothetical protein